MSAMPVVWCTDPNSESKKPTAFALHGIQLQGNLSELQVLALRELVSAAAEGRLLIPTDGATVQLDCGISIGSAIVKDKQTQKPRNEAEESGVIKILSPINQSVEIKNKPELHQSCTGNDSCITIDRLFSANTFCSHPPALRPAPDPPADTEGPEPKYSDDIYHNPPPPNHYDELYAFLCCAKCISDPAVSRLHAIASGNYQHRRPHITSHRSKLSLDHVTYVTNRYLQKNARHHNRKQPRKATNTWSLKKLKLALGSSSSRLSHQHNGKEQRRKEVESPLYAMVKKGSLHKILPLQESFEVRKEEIENGCSFANLDHDLAQENVLPEVNSNTSSRKTSFDSSCTEHGSTDSGFIEMQNRISANAVDAAPEVLSGSVFPNTKHLLGEEYQPSSLQFNVKECLALKSRNRRKSYEEFKAIFKKPSSPVPRTQPSTEPISVIKPTPRPVEKVKSRRKSYEEFKQLVKECDAALTEQRLQRKNSKRHCRKSSSPALDPNSPERKSLLFSHNEDSHKDSFSATPNDTNICGTIYDILHRRISSPSLSSSISQNKEAPVKRLSSRALYDKMLSYGTLYDIVQQKQEDGTYQKYDQYMTYGTIYEILQRKSEDYEVFQRKRALSDKCIKRGLARFATGTKYNTLNFGTIYDILQRKQAFLSEVRPSAVANSRFSVKKVSEDVLNTTVTETVAVSKAIPVVATPEYSETKPSKKATRIRRFSNILSYTPRHSSNESPRFSIENIPPSIAEILDPTAAEVQQELYSRLRRNTSADIVTTNNTKSLKSASDPPTMHTRKLGLGLNQCDELQQLKCDKNSNSDSRQQQQVVDFTMNNTCVERSMSITTRKALWRKDKSRRLSEFTRGEFLNEKL